MSDIASLLATPEFHADPYPVYDVMRGTDRVLWLPGMERWLVTGHCEALALLGHAKASANRKLAGDTEPWPDDGVQPRGLPFLDPPDHTRLRGLVQRAFTLRGVQKFRSQVEQAVDELLTAAGERAEFDLVADFAGLLPVTALASLLGLPAEDHKKFHRWVTTIIETIDPVSHRLISNAGTEDRVSMKNYFTDIIEQRRKDPQDDLISAMVQAEENGEQLTSGEILDMCVILTMAGLDSTTNLIANGMNALFTDPGQLARLQSAPGLIKSAIEELARYDSPVQLAGRFAREDFELGGHLMRAGQTIGVILGAANRDPLAFSEPGRLDLARSPNNHLGFGRGIHFCIGAPLARMEGAIAITALITRFPRLQPAGEGKRRHNVHVRGFESLPVALR